MTPTSTARRSGRVAPHSPSTPRLPDPDTVVVTGSTSFGDDVWDLSALSARPTSGSIRLLFANCPTMLRPDVKHFIYLLLTVDTPLEQLTRTASARNRLAPATVKSVYEDLKPLLTWCHERGTRTLAELTDQDLRDYAVTVQALPISQNPQGRRLFAVSRLWLMAPYMRVNARLRQPFWESEGIEQVIGKSEWTAENKSVPIHPATMSALLVWCLRLVEDGPRILPALRLTSHAPHHRPPATPPVSTWAGTITPRRADYVRRMLVTASLITIAYLTGMRRDEVLALRRGCCTPSDTSGGEAGGFEIRGRTFKSAVADGRSIPAGIERDTPWMAIKPVADAIAVMEGLHDGDLLFPVGLFKGRPGDMQSSGPTSTAIRESTTHLIGWFNACAADLDRTAEVIPPDPEGHVNLRRLRRTLAWFIYRKPRGRVALGVQYGHLHAATTDGYGGRTSAGLRDLFPMEEAFSLSDTLHQAAEHLDTNPNVSGPAADRYRHAAAEYRRRYQGLTLTTRQAAAVLENPDLRVYDAPGQTLACCFDARTALCRKETGSTTGSRTPDLTACEDRCVNVARTDQHIAVIDADIQALRAELDAPLTPEPLRHRIQAQITHREALVTAHQQGDGP